MADNVAITAGTGTTVAADEVTDGTLGSCKVQFVKLMDGTLDGTTKAAVSSAGLKVDLGADNDVTVTTTATTPVDVSTLLKITNVTLSLDTSAYASGDVLADSQIISACLRENDGTGTITNVTLTDVDDQGQGLDLLFLDANVSLGTENSAPSISDANAANILGWVRINASDWIDLGGVRLASVPCTIPVKGVSGADDLYIAAISRGTGTYTASGIVVRVAIACD